MPECLNWSGRVGGSRFVDVVPVGALILASIGVLLAALARWRWASSASAFSGLSGTLVYTDQGEAGLLVAGRCGLVGRPDSVRNAGELAPVEHQSREVSPSGPFDASPAMYRRPFTSRAKSWNSPLTTLVEGRFQIPVRLGQLQCLNRFIDVPFDDDLRSLLVSALDALKPDSRRTRCAWQPRQPGQAPSLRVPKQVRPVAPQTTPAVGNFLLKGRMLF